MILHRYNAVFMHIDRTGGSSIEELFGFVGKKGHQRGRELRKLAGPRWESAFKFTIVRNQWDRLVSLWHWHTRIGMTSLDWDVWLEGVCDGTVMPHRKASQLAWFEGETFDFVGRFERLQQDVDEVCRRIGFEGNSTLPHLKRSDHVPYQAYYSGRRQDVVASVFAEDISEFGWRFGE